MGHSISVVLSSVREGERVGERERVRETMEEEKENDYPNRFGDFRVWIESHGSVASHFKQQYVEFLQPRFAIINPIFLISVITAYFFQ